MLFGGILLPGKKLLSKNEGFIEAWNAFINKGILKRDLIHDFIADSWLRSKSYEVDPFSESIKIHLTNEELDEKYKEYKVLLNVAKPFMYSLYKIVGDTGFIVRLTDKDGYVLECGGDKEIMKKQGNLNMYKGCNVREEIIGTNAIGTALITGKPIQVLGAEHYCLQYHTWTSSACPIKDEQDEIVAVLSMSGPYEKVHPHTLGMIHASAEAIEKEMRLDQANNRLKMAVKHLNAIVESISEGLISINKDGSVRGINIFGRNILKLKQEDIVNKNISIILDNNKSSKLMKVIKNGTKFEEEEINFLTKRGRKIPCIVNATPIKAVNSNEVEGLVLTFKESKVVHDLVNKIVGAEARFTFDDILGESKEIKEAMKMAAFSAKADATILLLGESGTGKEMFAQAIHNQSKRKSRPFVFLNCGAIPRELVASELFGYVEGAFTGARRGGHPGKFELADGGTIFLDEIGDMPLDTQVNLLRVLENKEIVRVGGHDVIPVDVRVIAATHKDLKKEVELGNFRRDLYYRLNVMPIHTPSLRERKGDIRIFIDYFIEKFSGHMGINITKISDEFYRGMYNYDWPGNVRELQNVIQLVVNTIDDEEIIKYEHLPKYVKSSYPVEEKFEKSELLSLDEIERKAILNTLQKVNGNMSKAAKILGIGRSTLYRKLEKHKVKLISDGVFTTSEI